MTSGKNIKGAVGFLTSALAAIGIGSLPRLDLSFTGSNSLVFSFGGLTYRGVDPIALDSVLQGLSIPLSIPNTYVQMGGLHIAFEYAYARSVRLHRSDGREFAVDICSRLGEFIDVGGKASVGVHSKAQISFSAVSEEPAAFAYKAGRLLLDGGRWTFEPEVVAPMRAAGDQENRVAPFLPAKGVVLVATDC